MHRTLLAITLLAVALSACSLRESMYSLHPEVIEGTLIGGLQETPRVEIKLNGKIYSGPWTTSLPSREQLDAEAPVHQRHMRVMQAQPTASDGDALHCEWMLHGTEGSGTCTSGSTAYRLDIR